MIYVLPDLHIGGYLRRLDALRSDCYCTLNRLTNRLVTDLANDDDSVVLIAGDAFDRNRINGPEADAAREAIARMKAAGARVGAISGTHDAETEKPSLIVSQGAEDLNQTPIKSGGKLIRGISHRTRSELQERVAACEPCDLLVVHAAFEHLAPHPDAMDLRMEDVPEHVRNVASGHIHQAHLTLFGDRACLSPGVLYPLTVRQYDKHGYWTWDGENWHMEQISVRPVFQAEFYTEDYLPSLEQWLQNLDPGIPPEFRPAVSVRHRPELVETLGRLIEQYSDRAVLFGTLASPDAVDFNADEAEAVPVEQALAQETEGQPELQQFILQLIEAQKQDRVDELIQETTTRYLSDS